VDDANMKIAKFDPFSDRLARDTRNELSHALMHSLEESDSAYFRQACSDMLGEHLAPVYAEYIEDRLARYEEAFSEIECNEIKDPFARMVILWNAELFFEVHDLIESLWNAGSEGMRQALKALIKAAAVFIHVENGHKEVASRLARKAVSSLNKNKPMLAKVPNLDLLIERLEKLDLVPPKL